jgi:hypothetical protein
LAYSSSSSKGLMCLDRGKIEKREGKKEARGKRKQFI